ncbi:hypothetical protein CTI12_AA462080 [Artemisia annua]|uniref:Uncharacterized protein n=1 Tax=Artemisia annua TaxID=35608 RepID=A0A2U1LRT1_ARTAN|nr:hypothetical protein CTI12_AA462080 [Artemisia annua]
MYPSNGQPPPSSPLQAAYGQPPMAQYATGVPPQPMVSYGKWSTGLCGCCDDVCNCHNGSKSYKGTLALLG